MTRMSRGAAIMFATVALAAGVLVSGANAAPPPPADCTSKSCKDDVAAFGLSGKAVKACTTAVEDACKAGTCSCLTGATNPCSALSPPPVACTTTTTTTTTSTTTSTTTTTTTSTTSTTST